METLAGLPSGADEVNYLLNLDTAEGQATLLGAATAQAQTGHNLFPSKRDEIIKHTLDEVDNNMKTVENQGHDAGDVQRFRTTSADITWLRDNHLAYNPTCGEKSSN